MKTKSLVIAIVSLLGVATLGSSALAAQQEWTYFWDGGTGNKYWDCVNRPLNSGGYGADNAGNTLCIAAHYTTGTWKVAAGSCAGATKQRALIMGNFLPYCDSGYTSWTTQISCNATFGTKLNSTGAACVNRTLYGFAQGTL